MNRHFPVRIVAVAALTAAALLPSSAFALSNPLAVTLETPKGALTEASATIFQAGSQVLVNVIGRRKIPAGSAVTLNSGSCTKPGGVAFALSRFADNESLTQLKHPTSDIVAHAKSMVIHTTSSETSPVFACGPLDG